jgi:hypothetical protein
MAGMLTAGMFLFISHAQPLDKLRCVPAAPSKAFDRLAAAGGRLLMLHYHQHTLCSVV